VGPQKHLRGEVPKRRAATDLRLGVLGIRLVGRHGVHPEEREAGNRFEVDVEWDCLSAAAVDTDALTDTIDYQQVADLVHTINRRRAFNLIESFAGAIADEMLARFPGISATIVRVTKHAPPGLSDVDGAVAQVTCRRG